MAKWLGETYLQVKVPKLRILTGFLENFTVNTSGIIDVFKFSKNRVYLNGNGAKIPNVFRSLKFYPSGELTLVP